MNKYLINILKETNTIIIPGIGALTIVNQVTGEVMFMPFMKFDDGKLAEFIAKKEQWELNDAINLVSKYVRDINTKLDQGDSYDIYQFGSFTKNVEGEIEFTPWNGSSTNNSESPNDTVEENAIRDVEPIIVEAIKENQEVVELNETKIEEDPIIDSIGVAENASIIENLGESDSIVSLNRENEDKEKEIVNQSSTISNDDIEQIIPDTAPLLENVILSVEEQMQDDLDVPPINAVKEITKKPILEKAQKDKFKKKRGVGFYMLMLLIVLLIGGGILFGLNYKELKQYVPFLADNPAIENESNSQNKSDQITKFTDEKSSDRDNDKIVPEKEEVGTQKNVEKENEVPEPKPIAITNSGIDKSLPIQVVVGSFSEEGNAIRKVESLKSQGIDADIIGQYGGLYFVSAGSFSTMEDMKAKDLSSMGKYWIYKR